MDKNFKYDNRGGGGEMIQFFLYSKLDDGGSGRGKHTTKHSNHFS